MTLALYALAVHPWPGLRRAAPLAVALSLACGDAEATRDPVPTGAATGGSGTARMVERLDSAADAADRELLIYHGNTRVSAVLAERPEPTVAGLLNYGVLLGEELLHAGRVDDAIQTLDSVRALMSRNPEHAQGDFALNTLEMLAASHLHRSFQEHCVQGRTQAPCTLLAGTMGRHERPEDSRAAIALYREILELRPDDVRSRFLMNLAYMNLGEYPSGVPIAHRIPPEALRAEHDIGAFRDVAPALDLDVVGRAGGAIMDDFDNDGFLDVFASSWGIRDQVRYFRNEGDGRFTQRTDEAGLKGITGGLMALQADYDNDGLLDILVLRGAWLYEGHPNSLLRNRGDGTFEDVTEAAGLLDVHPTQAAAWGDFDGDGLLDLFIGNESTAGRNTDPAQLFRNDGDGTFTDVAEGAGVAVVGFTKGVAAGDYDDDGLLDLYLSRLDQPNILFRNAGPGRDGTPRFVDVTEEAGVTEPLKSFPTWFFDYDDDGRLDLFVSGYWAEPGEVAREYLGLPLQSGTPKLYRNLGDGTFEDVTGPAGLERVMQTMGSNYGDLDNDGYPDFYVTTGDPGVRSIMPNRMFRNSGGGHFLEVTASGGFGLLGKGHAVAFGDADNDGDQDIYTTMGGAHYGDPARNAFFANPGHGNAWITLQLEGARSNRSAIGARVRVRVDTPGGMRDLHGHVSSGSSFGANSLRLEMGLGDARAVREVEVWWPTSGRRDVYRDAEPGRVYRLREGAPRLEPIEVGRFDLDAVGPTQDR